MSFPPAVIVTSLVEAVTESICAVRPGVPRRMSSVVAPEKVTSWSVRPSRAATRWA
jgi:hypothetical protein